ncbi:hypothetical protein LJB42_003642 [Komagataella kurtzmanii]|nr:hypothetical protein LJB42_003642 [Komagataella kurtzmanii]
MVAPVPFKKFRFHRYDRYTAGSRWLYETRYHFNFWSYNLKTFVGLLGVCIYITMILTMNFLYENGTRMDFPVDVELDPFFMKEQLYMQLQATYFNQTNIVVNKTIGVNPFYQTMPEASQLSSIDRIAMLTEPVVRDENIHVPKVPLKLNYFDYKTASLQQSIISTFKGRMGHLNKFLEYTITTQYSLRVPELTHQPTEVKISDKGILYELVWNGGDEKKVEDRGSAAEYFQSLGVPPEHFLIFKGNKTVPAQFNFSKPQWTLHDLGSQMIREYSYLNHEKTAAMQTFADLIIFFSKQRFNLTVTNYDLVVKSLEDGIEKHRSKIIFGRDLYFFSVIGCVGFCASIILITILLDFLNRSTSKSYLKTLCWGIRVVQILLSILCLYGVSAGIVYTALFTQAIGSVDNDSFSELSRLLNSLELKAKFTVLKGFTNWFDFLIFRLLSTVFSFVIPTLAFIYFLQCEFHDLQVRLNYKMIDKYTYYVHKEAARSLLRHDLRAMDKEDDDYDNRQIYLYQDKHKRFLPVWIYLKNPKQYQRIINEFSKDREKHPIYTEMQLEKNILNYRMLATDYKLKPGEDIRSLPC